MISRMQLGWVGLGWVVGRCDEWCDGAEEWKKDHDLYRVQQTKRPHNTSHNHISADLRSTPRGDVHRSHWICSSNLTESTTVRLFSFGKVHHRINYTRCQGTPSYQLLHAAIAVFTEKG